MEKFKKSFLLETARRHISIVFLLPIFLTPSLPAPAQQTNLIDTSALKYYPLSVGNRWVWNHYWNYSGNTRIWSIVLDTLVTNGHKYFLVRSRIPPPGSGTGDSHVRVDSVWGNCRIYTTGSACGWLQNESSQDSFYARYLDSFLVGCSESWYTDRDTSNLIR